MIALLAVAMTTFSGGSTNDLAHLLRDSTHQDVVIERLSVDELKGPVDFDPTSGDSMNQAFRSKFDLHILPATLTLFTDEQIPAKLYAGLHQSVRGPRGQQAVVYLGGGGPEAMPAGPGANRKPLTGEAVKDGKITFKTQGKEALDMSSLLSVPLGKPLTMGWVYLDDTPAIDVQDSAIPVFLDKLAKAVGGKFHQTDKTYAIDFQPDEFRRRAVHTLGAIKTGNTPEDAVYGAKVRLAIGALNLLSSQDLTTVFESPGGRITVPITNQNGLVQPATAYLLALEKNGSSIQDEEASAQGDQINPPIQTQRPGRRQNQGRQIAGIMSRIDPTRLATLTFDASFGVQIEVPIMDRQGRPAGTVRF